MCVQHGIVYSLLCLALSGVNTCWVVVTLYIAVFVTPLPPPTHPPELVKYNKE